MAYITMDQFISLLKSFGVNENGSELKKGNFTLFHSHNVNNEKFARDSVKHKFHRYLMFNALTLKELISYCICHCNLVSLRLIV